MLRFHVTLPIDTTTAGDLAQTAAAGALQPGLRVLVAEDNATNRLVAMKLLERLGC